MTSNLRALLEMLTPMSDKEAEAAIAADLARNAHRYGPPSPGSIVLENPEQNCGDENGRRIALQAA